MSSKVSRAEITVKSHEVLRPAVLEEGFLEGDWIMRTLISSKNELTDEFITV